MTRLLEIVQLETKVTKVMIQHANTHPLKVRVFGYFGVVTIDFFYPNFFFSQGSMFLLGCLRFLPYVKILRTFKWCVHSNCTFWCTWAVTPSDDEIPNWDNFCLRASVNEAYVEDWDKRSIQVMTLHYRIGRYPLLEVPIVGFFCHFGMVTSDFFFQFQKVVYPLGWQFFWSCKISFHVWRYWCDGKYLHNCKVWGR